MLLVVEWLGRFWKKSKQSANPLQVFEIAAQVPPKEEAIGTINC